MQPFSGAGRRRAGTSFIAPTRMRTHKIAKGESESRPERFVT
jgi:hypothetical protein